MKRFVFFGCSFTMGHELADHDLLNISFDECNKLKKQTPISEWNSYLLKKTGLSVDEIINLSKLRAWPTKLCNKLNVDYLNLALPGSPLENSYVDFLTNHQRGTINPKTDVIVVALSFKSRWLMFNYKNPSYLLSMCLGSIKKNDSKYKLFFEHYNDYKIIWDYYNTLSMFHNDATQRGYVIKYQPTSLSGFNFDDKQWHIEFSKINENWNLFPILREKFLEIKNNMINPNINLFTYKLYDHECCGYKHPPEKLHEQFAEDLYKTISKENWWKS